MIKKVKKQLLCFSIILVFLSTFVYGFDFKLYDTNPGTDSGPTVGTEQTEPSDTDGDQDEPSNSTDMDSNDIKDESNTNNSITIASNLLDSNGSNSSYNGEKYKDSSITEAANGTETLNLYNLSSISSLNFSYDIYSMNGENIVSNGSFSSSPSGDVATQDETYTFDFGLFPGTYIKITSESALSFTLNTGLTLSTQSEDTKNYITTYRLGNGPDNLGTTKIYSDSGIPLNSVDLSYVSITNGEAQKLIINSTQSTGDNQINSDSVTYSPGDLILYEIIYTPTESENVQITDTLPTGLDFMGASFGTVSATTSEASTTTSLDPSQYSLYFKNGNYFANNSSNVTIYTDSNKTISFAENTVTWTISSTSDDTETNESNVVSLLVSINGQSNISNTATVKIDNSAINTQTVTSTVSGPYLFEDQPGSRIPVSNGDTVNYTINLKSLTNGNTGETVTITNPINSNLDNTTVEATDDGEYNKTNTDQYPNGVITWTFENNNIPDSVSFSAKVKKIDNGNNYITNQATISIGTTTSYNTNTIDNLIVDWTPQKTEVSVNDNNLVQPNETNFGNFNYVNNVLQGPSVNPSDTITYRISWNNNTENPVTITITDILDSNLSYVENFGAFGPTGNTYTTGVTFSQQTINNQNALTWNLTNVAEGASGYVQFQVSVLNTTTTGNINNRATVTVGNTEYITNNIQNSISQLTKVEVTPGEGKEVSIDDPVNYAINWNKPTNVTNQTVTISDTLESGLTFNGASFINGQTGLTSQMVINAINNQNQTQIGVSYSNNVVTWTNNGNSISYRINNTGATTVDEKLAGGTVSWTFLSNLYSSVFLNTIVNNNAYSVTGETGYKLTISNSASITYNDNTFYSNIVENPLSPKVNVIPGNNNPVQYGNYLAYEIFYSNDTTEQIEITDQIDPGTNFVAAGFGAIPPNVAINTIPAITNALTNTSIIAGTTSYEEANTQNTVSFTKSNYQYNNATPANTGTLGGGTVQWSIASANNDTIGVVYLIVQVNSTATYGNGVNGDTTPGKIVNSASVNGTSTSPTQNPVPPYKMSVSPSPGEPVTINETVSYNIYWGTPGTGNPNTVTITDVLDPGLDFVSATFEGNNNVGLLAGNTTYTNTIGTYTYNISYNATTRVLTWTISGLPNNTTGYVTLNCKVNSNSIYTFTGTPPVPTSIEDYEISNNSTIQVNTNTPVITNNVENQVIAKTINSQDEIENIIVGDNLNYNIHWALNTQDKPGVVSTSIQKVVITDVLDIGVDFVGATLQSGSTSGLFASNFANMTPVNNTYTYSFQSNIPGIGNQQYNQISYNTITRTVTWTFYQELYYEPSNNVGLLTKVNSNALTAGTVENYAQVNIQVNGNETSLTTNKVTTPVLAEQIGSLTLILEALEAESSETFPITLNLTTGNQTFIGSLSYNVTGTITGLNISPVAITNGQLTFNMTPGSSITFNNVPLNTGYKVSEEEPDGYEVNYTPSNGGTITTANLNGRVNIVNTQTQEETEGNLTVSKTISGNEASSTDVFNFSIELDDDTISGTYGDIEFDSGLASISLSGGESLTATGLPASTIYSVTEDEANQNGYVTTVTGDVGTISSGETSVAAFTNTKDQPSPTGYGDLTVTKTVAGNNGDTEEEFTFTVTLVNGSNITGSYGDMDFVNGEAMFTLKHNESMTAEDLPVGTNYVVEESEADENGYTTTATNAEGTITNELSSAAFTNTRNSKSPIMIEKFQAQNKGSQVKTPIYFNNGDVITYYLIVSNMSTDPLEDIVVTDVIANGLNIVPGSISSSGNYESSTRAISWIIDSLGVEESVTLDFKVSLPSENPANTTYRNVAYVSYMDEQISSNEVILTNSKGGSGGTDNPGTGQTTTTTTTTQGTPYSETIITTTTETSPKTGLDQTSLMTIWIVTGLFALIIVSLLGLNRYIIKLKNRN